MSARKRMKGRSPRSEGGPPRKRRHGDIPRGPGGARGGAPGTRRATRRGRVGRAESQRHPVPTEARSGPPHGNRGNKAGAEEAWMSVGRTARAVRVLCPTRMWQRTGADGVANEAACAAFEARPSEHVARARVDTGADKEEPAEREHGARRGPKGVYGGPPPPRVRPEDRNRGARRDRPGPGRNQAPMREEATQYTGGTKTE